ncbi:MAG: copper homeostasis protein CutC [Rhodothermales bacterium]|jgi:copper homeostasis protein CutC
MTLVESCCESMADVLLSERAGANRIELCADLASGGQTPEADLIREACSVFSGPVMVLVRPRSGGFVYTPDEIELTVRQIRESLAAGAFGVVVGCMDARGRVDRAQLKILVQAADGEPVTFHKAFDEAADHEEAYLDCADLGVARVLTSGGRKTALQGADVLARLQTMQGPTVLVGGGVRADHVEDLLRRTGARELHARASAIPALMAELG